MGAVWEHAPFQQTTLLVLLALADHASDDGTAWPAVPRIAARARTTERHVRRILSDLEAAGWVQRTERAGTSSVYRLTPDLNVTPDAHVTPDAEVSTTPDAEVSPPRTPTSATPDPHVSQTVTNHQENRQENRQPRGTRIPDPFPITAEMVAWARENTPGLDHRAITEEFIDYWRGAAGARGVKTDWPATWRNWLRKEHRTRGGRLVPTPGASTGTSRAAHTLALAQRYAEQEAQEGTPRAAITDRPAAG